MPPNNTEDQVQLMPQNLLIERLQLKIHRATRDITEGYSLTATKNGPKPREIKPLPDSESSDFDDGYVAGTLPDADTLLGKGHSGSMLQTRGIPAERSRASVLDNENLTGRYDF